MSPDLKKWPDVPGELKSEIEKFVGETALKNAIQQGFYFLRSGNGEKQIRKVILWPGEESEINDNQKKQALKENSDWYLVHGLRGCSKQHNK